MIRVVLPAHLKTLAGVSREVDLDVGGTVSAAAIVDALEERFPALRGTIRDPATRSRRPFIRFFADEEDLSHEPMDAPVPSGVASGAVVFYVIGAMAGG